MKANWVDPPPSRFNDGEWADLMQCVRETFASFNIHVTDVDPGKKTHLEIVVTDAGPELIGKGSNVLGVATWFKNGSTAENGVGWVFERAHAGPFTTCETVAHEAGHLLGLNHEYWAADVMSYLQHTSRQGFTYENARCGGDKPEDCTRKNPLTGDKKTQNSFDFLWRRLGPSGNSASSANSSLVSTRPPSEDMQATAAGMEEEEVEKVNPNSSVARAGSNCGYWKVTASGVVTGVNVPAYGGVEELDLAAPVMGIVSTPDGGGYWLVAEDGGVFAFGNAGFHGSAAELTLNAPIVGMASTPDGGGYWLVGSDGGIFAFGNAGFHGSAANMTLNEPVVGMAATPDGGGYWLVAEDGGVFAFGNAGFHGSATGITLTKPVVGITRTPSGQGYWLVAADGGVFAFGDAPFHGSGADMEFSDPVQSIASTPDGRGYWLMTGSGATLAYGNAANSCSSTPSCGQLGGTVCDKGGGECRGQGSTTWDCDRCCGGSVSPTCGQMGGSRCEFNGSGSCGGIGPTSYDCDRCCGGSITTCGYLWSGQSLGQGQSRSSCDGRFTLVLQGDGNLVLYHNGVGAIWATGTNSGTSLVMQGDGNLVLYNWAGQALWSTATNGYPDARLLVQNDGNMVVYSASGSPRWASNTCCR